MKFFGILLIVVVLIIFLENPKLIFNIINNIKTVRGFSKYNYILPF